MGQPAARVGDTTSHGTPLGAGPGCPTVLIGGQPAWRAAVGYARVPAVRRPEAACRRRRRGRQRDGDDRRPARGAAGRHGRRGGPAERDRGRRTHGDDRMSAERPERPNARTSSAAAGRCRSRSIRAPGSWPSVAVRGRHPAVDPDHPRDRAGRARDAAEFRLRHPRAGLRRARQHRDAADPLDRRGGAAPLRGAHRRPRRRRRRDGDRTRASCSSRSNTASARRTRSAISSFRSTSAREAGREAAAAPRLDERRSADSRRSCASARGRGFRRGDFDDASGDFGRALLEVAARFSSEVAERLDGAGEKMRRGFLDWLAVRGEAARPARMPVVFKLADTAHEAGARRSAGAAAGRRRRRARGLRNRERTCASCPGRLRARRRRRRRR